MESLRSAEVPPNIKVIPIIKKQFINKIIIDDREHKTKDYFIFPHIIKRLGVGDYHLYHDDKLLLIVERKTLKDLSASIKDKRIYRQIQALREQNIPYLFIIEGNFQQYRIDQKKKFNHLLPIASIKTRLRHMNEQNIKIIYTTDIIDTVNILELSNYNGIIRYITL